MYSPGSHVDDRHAFALAGSPLKYGSFGERKLALLCKGLRVSSALSEEATRVFRLLSNSWWDKPLGSEPAWKTDITDDGTPFEFSLAFDGRAPKLRMLVEAQEAPLTLTSSWSAGLRLNERLGEIPGVDLERFNRISDLFAPLEGVPARCALWHAAVMEANRPTMYKVYLNPQAHGPQLAGDVVAEALRRLNLRAASDFLLTLRGSPIGAQFLYFSLDLDVGREARVKIYLAHPGARSEDIEAALLGTKHHVPGDGVRWGRHLLGASGPIEDRPILTCLSFTSSEAVPSATLHVPIRDYTANDAQSADRACDLLNQEDASALRRALDAFALRPLASGRSLVTYISLRRVQHGLNVTTYLAPEAFAITPPRTPGTLPKAAGSGTRRSQHVSSVPPGS